MFLKSPTHDALNNKKRSSTAKKNCVIFQWHTIYSAMTLSPGENSSALFRHAHCSVQI